MELSIEMLLMPQLEGLVECGYQIHTASGAGLDSSPLDRMGITHHPLRFPSRSADLWKDVRFVGELHSLIGRLKPDVVHLHTPKPGVIGRPLAWLRRDTGVVNTVHGLYAQPADPIRRRWPVYAVERLAAAFSDAELYQNHEDLETMRRLRVPNRKLHYIGNGVDLARFRPRPELRAAARESMGIADPGAVVVGCVARLVKEKGIPELVEAFKLAKCEVPQLHLILIGPEDDSRKDVYRIDSSIDGLHALGLRKDVELLYQGMDIFSLLSHREGFPRSVMEASACGVPVVASHVRGCDEAVADRLSGYLVPVQQPACAAEHFVELARNAELRRSLGRGAEQLAKERFDVRQQVEILDKIYRDLGAD